MTTGQVNFSNAKNLTASFEIITARRDLERKGEFKGILATGEIDEIGPPIDQD
jgi:hypothetical protein